MVVSPHPPINLVMIKRPGELLHIDNMCPSQDRSVGGKWYVLVIFYDYSRYSWVFFLVSKDEVFSHFQSLALIFFKELLGALKAIHSDNGTTFRNYLFDVFYLEHDIEHQCFAPMHSSVEWHG